MDSVFLCPFFSEEAKFKMKKALSIALLIILSFSLFSCTDNEQSELYKQALSGLSDTNSEPEVSSAMDETKALAGELNIYVNPIMRRSIYPEVLERFNERYPNIKVNLLGPEELGSTDDYSLITSVELMGGENIDLIDLCMLPIDKYAKSGLFTDLYPFMESDSDIHMDDYFTNLFEAFEYKGGLYSMPLWFNYPICRLNNELLRELGVNADDYEAVSFNQIYEWYDAAIEKGIASPNLMFSNYQVNDLFDWFEYPVYMDEESGEVNFYSPEFITYLEQVKKAKWSDTEPISGRWMQDFLDLNIGKDNFFLYKYFWDENLSSSYFKSSNSATQAIPIISSNGERPFLTSTYGPIAMLESSQNKEIAWEFLKMQIEEFELSDYKFDGMEQDFFFGGLHVNRNNSQKLLQREYGSGHEEEIEYIMDWYSQLNRHSYATENSDLRYILHQICEEYYTDLISAEECAKKVQERAYMFLNE